MQPNALNAFTLLEGTFGVLWFCYAFVVFYTYRREVGMLQSHIDAFNMLVWIPLYLGALYAAVGSFYTAPGALDQGPLQRQWHFHRIIRHPWVINSISLGTPLALAAGLIPCAVLTQNDLAQNFRDYEALSRDLKVAASSNSVSAAQAQEFISRAGSIWNNVAVGKRYLCIGYAIWTAFSGLLLLFYVPAGGYMLRLLYTQVQKQKNLVLKIERQQEDMLRAEQEQEEQEAMTVGTEAPRDRKDHDTIPRTGHSLLFQPLSDERPAEADNGKPNELYKLSRASFRAMSDSQPTSPTMRMAPSSAHSPVPPQGEGDVFFPPLRSAQQKREEFHLSNDAPPVTRWKYLRRCFRSLLILYLGIIAAATIYLIIAARLAAVLYDAFLSGPDAATYLVATSHQPTAWAAVIFGTLTLGAIFCRFLDASQQEKQSSRHSVAARPNHAKKAGSNGDPAAAQIGHILSRSLPPVPESAGGGMSQQVLSQSVTSGTIQEGPLREGGKSNRHALSKSVMKFSLAADQRKPGALMMMPVDSEANSFAYGEDPATATVRSWRGLIPSRQKNHHRGPVRGVPEDVTQASFMSDELRSRPDHIAFDMIPITPAGAQVLQSPLAPERTPARTVTETGDRDQTLLPALQLRSPTPTHSDFHDRSPTLVQGPSSIHMEPTQQPYPFSDVDDPRMPQSALYPSHHSGWPGLESHPFAYRQRRPLDFDQPSSFSSHRGYPTTGIRQPPPSTQVYAFAGASPSRGTRTLPSSAVASTASTELDMGRAVALQQNRVVLGDAYGRRVRSASQGTNASPDSTTLDMPAMYPTSRLPHNSIVNPVEEEPWRGATNDVRPSYSFF